MVKQKYLFQLEKLLDLQGKVRDVRVLWKNK